MDCPAGTNYAAIAAAGYSSLALRNDGTLVGWGVNSYGQTNCPAGTKYVAIAANGYCSLALRNDGTLVGWGDNTYGQANCPAGSNYVAIAAGTYHSLALRNDHTVIGWGRNSSGEINCPTGNNHMAIAGGGNSSLALQFHLVIDITNAPFIVDTGVAECTIGGTNAPESLVSGMMWWINRANGAAGTVEVTGDRFQVTNIPLAYGENTIVVYGSNVYAMVGSDAIVVARGHVALVAPPDGWVTNTPSLFLDAFFSTAMVRRCLMTNATPVFDPATAFTYTSAVSFREPGEYYWTAAALDEQWRCLV